MTITEFKKFISLIESIHGDTEILLSSGRDGIEAYSKASFKLVKNKAGEIILRVT